MIKRSLLVLAISLLGFVVYLSWYTGYFKDVEIALVPTPTEYTLLGFDHRGAYHEIVPLLEKAEAWAKAAGVQCKKTFGLFLDDPRRTEQARLRSFAGCLFENDEELLNPAQELAEGMRRQSWSASQMVLAKFRGAPSIAPFTVYPEAQDYLRKQGLSTDRQDVLEVYQVESDQKSVTTHYHFPISPGPTGDRP